MMDDFDFWKPNGIPSLYPHLSDFFVKTSDQHYAPLYFITNITLFQSLHVPSLLYLANIVFLYLDSLALFYLVWQVSGDFITAILTASFFCVHPMTAAILQHLTLNNLLIAGFLMLVGLIGFYQYLTRPNTGFLYVLSILCLAVALFYHEGSMLFVFYAASMAFILAKRGPKEIFKICLPFIAIEMVFFILWFVLSKSRTLLSENNHSLHIFWDLPANYFHVSLWYISHLFQSQGVVFMYNTPAVTHVAFWNFLFLISLLCVFALISYFRKPLEIFALVWFLTGFLIAIPAFSSRPYNGFIFEPNWMFFSSMGFSLFLALMLQKLEGKIDRRLWIFLLPTIFMYFFVQTEKVNIINRTQFNFCENWLRNSPGNYIPATILAQEYYIPDRVPPSMEFFNSMLSLLDIYLQHDYYDISLRLITRLSSMQLSESQRKALQLRENIALYEKQ